MPVDSSATAVRETLREQPRGYANSTPSAPRATRRAASLPRDVAPPPPPLPPLGVAPPPASPVSAAAALRDRACTLATAAPKGLERHPRLTNASLGCRYL